jgi:predicted dehydrogenase
MRVGVVGLGSMGLRHVMNLVALGCDVIGMDPSAEARQQAMQAGARRVVWDWKPIFVEGIRCDAFVIATPIEHHLEWADATVRLHRTACFVEKPLGTLDQLPAWRKLVKEASGLVTQVGYMLRFHEAMKLFRMAAPGESSEFLISWDSSKYEHKLLESSHEIDLALWLGGPQRTLETVLYHTVPRWGLWFSGDCSVHIDTQVSYGRQWEIETTAGVTVRAQFNDPSEVGKDMYRAELEHFLACVRDGKQTDCPWSDGLRVLEVCAQAVELAQQPA